MRSHAARILRRVADRLDPQPSQPSQAPRVVVTFNGQVTEAAVVTALRNHTRRNGLGGLA